jgi:hypothetical protein
MKLVGWNGDKLVLYLGRQEHRAFLRILKLYPRVPPAHHRLSRKCVSPHEEANQRLLEEALAEQRADHERFLQAFLADPARMTPTQGGCKLTLSTGDAEYMLQVLNDVRVGSWLLLGSPEGRVGLDSQEAWAMELSGFLQAELLSALDEAHIPPLQG